MPARGIARFESPVFGVAEGEEIRQLLEQGRTAEVDDRLLHLVHAGVPPSTMWTIAMEVGRLEAGG